MEMPYCQTKHQKACVCAWNTWIIYIWSTGAGLFARKNGWDEEAENYCSSIILFSTLHREVPLHHVKQKVTSSFQECYDWRNFGLIHVAHFLVRQFCKEDVRGRRSKSWYIEQRFSLICAKIMSCIGHFWPFRPSRAFAKFLISKAFVKYEKGQARWRQLWNI